VVAAATAALFAKMLPNRESGFTRGDSLAMLLRGVLLALPPSCEVTESSVSMRGALLGRAEEVVNRLIASASIGRFETALGRGDAPAGAWRDALTRCSMASERLLAGLVSWLYASPVSIASPWSRDAGCVSEGWEGLDGSTSMPVLPVLLARLRTGGSKSADAAAARAWMSAVTTSEAAAASRRAFSSVSWVLSRSASFTTLVSCCCRRCCVEVSASWTAVISSSASKLSSWLTSLRT
jgi:hypothetical protein